MRRCRAPRSEGERGETCSRGLPVEGMPPCSRAAPPSRPGLIVGPSRMPFGKGMKAGSGRLDQGDRKGKVLISFIPQVLPARSVLRPGQIEGVTKLPLPCSPAGRGRPPAV